MNYQKVIIPINPITNTTDASANMNEACCLESKTPHEFATRGSAVVKRVLCEETLSSSVTKFYEWLGSEPTHDEIVAVVQLMGMGLSALAGAASAHEMKGSGTVH